jgi:hypothetical protein
MTIHCAAPHAATMETGHLEGRWDLTSVNGRPLSAGQRAHFEIDGMRIRGFDGCSSFGGRLDRPGEMAISQRACPDGARILPLDLTDPWRQLKEATVSEDRLSVETRAGEAVFTRRSGSE